MGVGVKSEAEYRQDRCSHLLKPIAPEDAERLQEPRERRYKYECTKCGKFLKQLNGKMITGRVPRP